MPIARFQMPDGRVAKYEVPEGTTPEQAQAMIEQQIKDDRPISESVKRGGQIVSKGLMTGLANTVALPLEASERISAPFRSLFNHFTGAKLPGKIDVMGGVQKDFGSLYGGIKPESGMESRLSDIATGAGGASIFPGAGLSGIGSAAAGSVVSGEMGRAGMPLWSQIVAGALTPAAMYGGVKGTLAGGKAVGGIAKSIDASLLAGGAERAAKRLAPKLALEGKDVSSVAGATAGNLSIDKAVAGLNAAGKLDDAATALAKTGNATTQGAASLLKKDMPSEYVDVAKRQAQARLDVLDAVTPDEQAAVAARKTATEQLYAEAAKGSTKIADNKDMTNILLRIPPAALREANELAKIDGAPFLLKGGRLPESINNQNMHYIKLGLDKILRGETKEPVSSAMKQKATQLKKEFLAAYEATNPAYSKARQAFAELSPPVDQAKVLTAMKNTLQKYPGIDESGVIPSASERVSPFLNVLGRGEGALLKRSTGMPRYQEWDLSKVLTPEQMSVVNKVGGELLADVEKAGLAKAGREKALGIMRETTKPGAGPGLVDRQISIFNWAVRALEGIGGRKTDEALSVLFLPENKQALALAIEQGRPSVKAAIINEAAKRQIKQPYAAVGATANAGQQ